jgi:predicted nucleotidyltransferase
VSAPEGLSEDPTAALASVLGGIPEVRWAYLFGSAARGPEFADLDVAVMLAPSLTGARGLGRIVAALEQAAPANPVDVVDLAVAAPVLAGRIVREGRVLVDREPRDRIRWEIETNGRALDIEPWLREFDRLRLKALRERAS